LLQVGKCIINKLKLVFARHSAYLKISSHHIFSCLCTFKLVLFSLSFCYFIGSSSDAKQSSEVSPESTDVMKNLEQQYESSRYLTHMARGLGLGYGFSSTSDLSELDK